VTPGGPAGKSAIRPGDVIPQVDGQKSRGASDVVDYVSSQDIGKNGDAALHARRQAGQTQVVLGRAPQRGHEAGRAAGRIGLALQTLTPDVADSLGIDRGTKGAVITDVVAGSPAEAAGLKPGDVIVEVDRTPVASSDQAVAASRRRRRAGRAILLRVRSAGGTRFVTIK
jgi:serine protease Do